MGCLSGGTGGQVVLDELELELELPDALAAGAAAGLGVLLGVLAGADDPLDPLEPDPLDSFAAARESVR